ncbi:MAG: AMP-binding protein [Bacteroidales bacterium]|jgi:o-succinylbenzoate synthase|nr:AMP-binding protein [Bacteroidales bacterium]
MYRIQIIPHLLHFKQPAGTSRGIYTTRQIYYVFVTSEEHPETWGVGECAPLPCLSCDDLPQYNDVLVRICRKIEQTGLTAEATDALRPYPSILFGLETAFRQLASRSFSLWNTAFSRGEASIPINGLIWMDSFPRMLRQIEEKLQAGFRCIKLKIGAIYFEDELSLIRHIRKHFPAGDVEIRVDANGAFSPDEALEKLKRLAEWDIHSIEQPIRAGQPDFLAQLTRETPLPIALDEELIGCNTLVGKQQLLETVQPQYIVLKPSLHGGLHGCREWIEAAERVQAGWWITSALESNIGLNAIAQWCATLNSPSCHGLGTGALFVNNTEMPLAVKNDRLWYFPDKEPSGYREYFDFWAEWSNSSSCVNVQTSGSTGTPKLISVRKEQMCNSARMCCTFLHLQQGDKALLCMPLQYIGAKMMAVRAWLTGMELMVRKPSAHPLAEVNTPLDFAAMTPMQVFNSLQIADERDKLLAVTKLIIGGGAIHPTLEKSLCDFPNEVYSTYGMTETLSHIAIRRLSGVEASPCYRSLPSVQLSLAADSTLRIDAPLVCDHTIATNDMAEILPDGSFRITGRKDNIINSGGIKIQAEAVEEKIRPFIACPFVITAVPDAELGERLVLLTEQTPNDESLRQIKAALSKYERPKRIIVTNAIPLAGNEKIDRTACRKLTMEN